jgi:hypothetical protein
MSPKHFKKTFCFAKDYLVHREMVRCYVGWHGLEQLGTYVHLNNEK